MANPRYSFSLISPLLAGCLLLGIAAQKRTYIKPQDVDPYHARVKTAIEAVPWIIGDGNWTGKEVDVPTAAQKLLRQNAILSRTYFDKSADDWGRRDRAALLLIVQCRDSRDMLGHFPPVCYRSHGMNQESAQKRDWTVGGVEIHGMEYQFSQHLGQTYRTTVYNFFVVPNPRDGQCMKRDMDSVRDAAEDYQQRHYGAAQFQVVFHNQLSADLPQSERDEIFATLIEPTIPVIKTLASGGLQ